MLSYQVKSLTIFPKRASREFWNHSLLPSPHCVISSRPRKSALGTVGTLTLSFRCRELPYYYLCRQSGESGESGYKYPIFLSRTSSLLHITTFTVQAEEAILELQNFTTLIKQPHFSLSEALTTTTTFSQCNSPRLSS